jgi:hypothetical protein
LRVGGSGIFYFDDAFETFEIVDFESSNLGGLFDYYDSGCYYYCLLPNVNSSSFGYVCYYYVNY